MNSISVRQKKLKIADMDVNMKNRGIRTMGKRARAKIQNWVF